MLLRMAFVPVGILLAAPAAVIGEKFLATIVLPWIASENHLRTLRELDNVSSDYLIGLLLTLVTFGCGAIVIAHTIRAVCQGVMRLFSSQAQHVSLRKIVHLSILLAIGACIYGGLVMPIAHGWTPRHLLLFPDNIVEWYLLAPLVLVSLNFLREIHRAFAEYEERVGVSYQHDFRISKKLDDILEYVSAGQAPAHYAPNISAGGLHSDLRNIVEILETIPTMLDQMSDVSQQRADGIFRQLREMRPRTLRLVSPPAISAVAHDTRFEPWP